MSEEYAVPATGALVLDSDDEMFLMQSPKWGNQWLVPGGKVERGDSLEETVRREIREETGLEVTDVELLEAKDGGNPAEFERDTHFVFLNFVCRAENRDVELDEREAVDYVWIDPAEALESDLDINDSTRGFIRTYLRERSPTRTE